MNVKEFLKDYKIDNNLLNLLDEAEEKIQPIFVKLEKIKEFNFLKVLKAFHSVGVNSYDFKASSGYGIGEELREKTEKIFAKTFNSEAALVRPQIISGTHALAIALFGILRPKDELLSLTGAPYDTLEEVIGKRPSKSSLKEFGITYKEINLTQKNKNEKEKILKDNLSNKTKLAFIQRSRGYKRESALTIDEIKEIVETLKCINPKINVLVDNCYGEFVEKEEPLEVGADILASSFMKNLGAGIVPTGGYLVGKKDLIELVSYKFTAPGVGREIGPNLGFSEYFLKGLILAPQIVFQALKGAVFTSYIFEKAGFKTFPHYSENRGDIVQAIKLNTKDDLMIFGKTVQELSFLDNQVTPVPNPMGGYEDKILMAGGTFVQGSSIELSADAPLKEPYFVYFQGGMYYEHIKITAIIALDRILKNKKRSF